MARPVQGDVPVAGSDIPALPKPRYSGILGQGPTLGFFLTASPE